MGVEPSIILLPKDHDNPNSWEKLMLRYKDFRLHALDTSPEAYSPSSSRENAFTQSDWDTRLRNPQSFTFVALKDKGSKSPLTTEAESVGEELWIGMIVLVILTDTENGGSNEFSSKPRSLDCELAGLFVEPSARRLGIAKALIEAAILYGRRVAYEKGIPSLFKLTTRTSNVAALNLYTDMGFVAEASDYDHVKGIAKFILRT
ncbi:hypothetical protein GQ43DRAFT_117561 [Delitschia confertaspora ATCC 74209]|uniref:N-acetyltransferase domain-containing protein n=1 Tax=Delitschia confertaspora ATCC 74209 TaxID=1513339 RepID=A0A9P4JJG7_9PLEO|nr:hypothetical protein GQ43DRAFT_117561 [Delitschia confertaspora ATCC 74209]